MKHASQPTISRLEPARQTRGARIRRRLLESWPWYLMALPAIIYTIIFDYASMYGVVMAFQDFKASKGFFGSQWVGMKHFIRFFTFPGFKKMMVNTLRISLLSLSTFPCSILFALFLDEVMHRKFKKAAQMITYMPHFMSEVIVCALVVMLLDTGIGPLGKLFTALTGAQYDTMADPDAFPWVYVLSGLWKNLGWGSILYLSGLASVSSEELEAARIDGASRFQTMWHIKLPTIVPSIAISLILRFGNLFNVGFQKILLLQNDLTKDISQVLGTYIYEIGLRGGQYSYAAAIGLVNNVMNLIIILIANRICKKVTSVGLV